MEKKGIKFDEKDIVQNGLLAAMYVALTKLLAPISFNAIQFRVSSHRKWIHRWFRTLYHRTAILVLSWDGRSW